MPPEPEDERNGSTHSRIRPDSTLVTLAIAAALALIISAIAAYLPSWQEARRAQTRSDPATAVPGSIAAGAGSRWAASAPGRVKPRGGEIKIVPEATGIITDVYAKVGDKVHAGDPLAKLNDEDALARLGAARAEVQVRMAEREEDEEAAKKPMLAWRKHLDAFAAAERGLHEARVAFDSAYLDRKLTEGPAQRIEAARKAVAAAKAAVALKRKALSEFEAQGELPPVTRLDSGLAIARSDLRLAENAYYRTRIRATTDGSILRLDAKTGEMAGPGNAVPIAIVGDLGNLEVTAEVEERDIGSIALGQHVIVRSNAFEGQDHAGKVVRIAPRVATPGLGLRGPSKPRDVEILEVEIVLDGMPPLLSGMRVDVFFRPKGETKAAASSN